MKQSNDFEQFRITLTDIVYKDNTSLLDLKQFIEGIIATLDLLTIPDGIFLRNIKHFRRQLELDLNIILNAEKRNENKNLEDVFDKCKRELEIDLSHANTGFKLLSR